MGVEVKLDDIRLQVFSQEFPATTHEAILRLRQLLESAEQRGRNAAASELTEEIAACVHEKTEDIARKAGWLSRRLDRVVDDAAGLASETKKLLDEAIAAEKEASDHGR